MHTEAPARLSGGNQGDSRCYRAKAPEPLQWSTGSGAVLPQPFATSRLGNVLSMMENT